MTASSDVETRQLRSGRASGRTVDLDGGSLLVVDGPDRGRRFLFQPPVIRIGSGEDNDVVLADETVSRHHLEIEETAQGHLARDLGSTNGTFVDGTRILQAFVSAGSTVRLGSAVLRLEPRGRRAMIEPSHRDRFGELQGQSQVIREVFGILETVCSTDLSILIRGETGTGKELAARALHEASSRSCGPFVVFDGSAVSRDLVESALFGHAPGAFTGAVGRRRGAFASADRGTLFVDEVGELPFELQSRLLRALERGEIQPLGSDDVQQVNVRVIAATHRDLRAMVGEGTFRRDLYYRLSVVEVLLPPLRERREDIPILVGHILERAGAAGQDVAPEAMQVLLTSPWEGNVRELRNVLLRAVAFAGMSPILPEHLQMPAPARPRIALDGGGEPGDRSLEEVEASAIAATLERAGWNKSRTAKILGVTRKTLLDKIAKYQLKPRS